MNTTFLTSYTKLRLIKAVSEEMQQIIIPILQTSDFKNNEMKMARI